MGDNFSYVEIAIVWVIYSACFYLLVVGIYRYELWLVKNPDILSKNLDKVITFSISIAVVVPLIIITFDYIPHGWVIFFINLTLLFGYIGWKPYIWHANNPTSLMVLKEHGINKPTFWNTRKIFFNHNRLLVNDQSIVKFYNDELVVIYWNNVKAILWYEQEIEEKLVDFLNVIISEDNFLDIDSAHKNFYTALEIIKAKFPDFSDNWNNRHVLPEEEIGTYLYQKYKK